MAIAARTRVVIIVFGAPKAAVFCGHSISPGSQTTHDPVGSRRCAYDQDNPVLLTAQRKTEPPIQAAPFMFITKGIASLDSAEPPGGSKGLDLTGDSEFA